MSGYVPKFIGSWQYGRRWSHEARYRLKRVRRSRGGKAGWKRYQIGQYPGRYKNRKVEAAVKFMENRPPQRWWRW